MFEKFNKTKTVILFLLITLIISCNNTSQKTDNKENIPTKFEEVPNWSKGVVWYQIFVETFRNGDSTNDPSPKDISEAYPGFVPSDWKITEWTHDWYKADDYFAGLEGKIDIDENAMTYFGQKSQLRRYGGDLQGVLYKIDYLDSLGITAIYFNPLNDAPSNHKFDARNWRQN